MLPSILQWNIRGLRSNSEELKILFNEENPSVSCLQETMLPTTFYNIGLNYRFYGTTPIINNIGRAKGGSAIIVKTDIYHELLALQTPLQAVAVKVVFKKQLTICSLYLEPGSNPTYNNLVNLIDQLETPFIILGDLNAHGTLWHCNSTNAKGRIIERILDDHNISLLNDDSPTHYTSHTNTTSIIDLGLCSSDILPDFQWNVLQELHGSDHFPIVIELNTQCKTPTLARWNLSKADWVLFQMEFSSVEVKTYRIDCLVVSYHTLEEYLVKSATKAIPQKYLKENHLFLWDKTC